MLFDVDDYGFESYKERNLYFKFFAGYYFNELIEGWQARLTAFCSMLAEPTYPAGHCEPPLLAAASTHVSFDNHLRQVVATGDQGRFADILLFDSVSRALVGIEAQFRADGVVGQDLASARRRLERAQILLGASAAVQVLLVTEAIWSNLMGRGEPQGSQFTLLNDDDGGAPMRVLTWESFLPHCASDAVVRYMTTQRRRLGPPERPGE